MVLCCKNVKITNDPARVHKNIVWCVRMSNSQVSQSTAKPTMSHMQRAKIQISITAQ